MIDYLNEDNSIRLFPTNIGLNDQSISSYVAEFNSLVVDRNRLLNNSSIENPLIKSLDGQIIELQQVLMTSLKT